MNVKDAAYLLKLAVLDAELTKFEKAKKILNTELEQHTEKEIQFVQSIQLLESKEKNWNVQVSEHEKLKEIETERLEQAKAAQQKAKDSSQYLKAKKQVDIAQKVIRQMEQALSALDVESQDWRKRLGNLRQGLGKLQGKIENTQQSLNENQAQKDQQMLKVDSQYQTTLAEVSTTWREPYQNLLNGNLRPIVVEINQANCMGCLLTIPAQIYQQVQLNLVGQCPHCNRLLVHQELAEDS